MLASGGCGERPAEGPARGASGRGRSIPVRTALVATRNVSYRVTALGSLEAEEIVQVTAEVEGAVTEVRFHEGARVTRDTVLVLIDPERYRLEVERAEANHLRAQSDLRRAQEELRRRERLANAELLAMDEVDRYRAASESLDADVAASKAALDIALQNQRRSEVKAPESGVINTRTIETGTYVRPGAVLATIVDVSRLRLRFKISEGESLQVAEGQDVSFRVAPIGPRDFVGRVYHVGEVADPTTRQVEVLAWVQNTGELKPGFFAEVSFNAGTKENAVVVPEAAIKASESGFVAYVVEEGKAVKKPIEIGLRTEDGLVEILSGLSGAETVVVEGSDLLADGVAVEDADLENPETPPAPPEGSVR
ncbi:MAG TPA: efflux RND transporter periplasmic adaptor subunit [Vicinamibacteria bacterium]|nr:efflux RND transporter periplasmic adaptor subunit [Vicinamibacteria bacterium]